MHIVGTAGHVDHGKSSLVRALTGTDPDRWAEEQRRGMTIDLGFAHLAFDDGVEAGIIDVPGHERFLHNMLAGAAGMELVLLVIAANEGPMPQTREHLTILEFLQARAVLVVLTKSDTVDAAGLAAMRAQVGLALRGTLAQEAPVIPVSTVTGAGLEELRGAIHTALRALPARAPSAPAYLPIDRVFARVGHGTVVTGTLMQGRVALGETLELSPLGRRVRVRGIQVFGHKHDSVAGGTRVAINLPGVETAEIARGAVLASAQLAAAASFDVTFAPLPETLGMLRRRTPVRAYIGSAEILGTLVFERAPTDAQPTSARLHLRTPTIAIPHAPFIVRRVSPMTVLGGGIIAAASGVALADDADDAHERSAVLAIITAAGATGATVGAIGALANLDAERVKFHLGELIADGRARLLAKPAAYIAATLADDVLARTIDVLGQRQRERPWVMGSTSLALAQRLALPEAALIRVLATFVEAGALVYRGGYYATVDFQPKLTAEQRAFFDAAFAPAAGSGSLPIAFDQLKALIRTSRVADVSAAFETLVASGALTRVGEFVYIGSQLRGIRDQLEAALRMQNQITVAEFRTLTGTSRKYAVPLLEFFDATGVTLRTGDVRVLRRTAPAAPASPAATGPKPAPP